ncbi:toll/interleukin-1 receptor domain-containing protein [Gluconacetobacter sp. 1b LMG 1731]|uniref:Toll/interleukin-1 receptor domain-containing protein n=1 Tax=Gluconacetobacter dulcium TaxID=2729096 RepID=A0A7W4IKK2_9PROT|nr:toll/interleukin-1 receptor domain-containing protein [Gluconacetobacter dulcium]MBB2164557.1 toll/interleukin-1 receptor domain-containing protein [Gluconacetobacter dulcium]MBB2193676.1 toll/interleukin-1 receptor domain-containing protein [Gluconacetobacter dulcium]
MKCFLSHSSRDKKSYAEILASALRPNIEYDEATFEEGMGNLEEIINALDRSSIFVLLISDNSLSSDWVKKEITEAHHRLNNGQLKRFFPIIIDPNINHTDDRIPSWIRDAYNLRAITRPTIAAKRIKERLVEASWQSHPMLKRRDQIFVGRNTQIGEFEQRFDDFTRPQPTVVFASGLNEIGRKTTIKHALRKANLVRDTYEPIRLDLSRVDNIEGAILKLFDIGITENIIIDNLMERTVSEKIELCSKLIKDILSYKEIILINDDYCVLRFDGDVAPWFEKVIDSLPKGSLAICVATSARPNRHLYINKHKYFFIHIPELEKVERIGLFKRYAGLFQINLQETDYENFIPLLKGFPEQVTYAINLIHESGIEKAFKESHNIANFSVYRANITIEKFQNDVDVINFLRFISSFEFVSIDFISNIESVMGRNINQHLDTLLQYNVCESIGASGDYFRVNEVIRDAILRDRFHIEDSYISALRVFVEDFSKNHNEITFDISEYQIAIREALSSGIKLPDRMLIPAHFLQTMRRLYDRRDYKDVVVLANRALINKENFDERTEQDIRYYLCQALARLLDPRFLDEVHLIHGPEHDFLMGFYYRLKRHFRKALSRYRSALSYPRIEQRARQEIVFVLINMEDFGQAISLARENFQRYPRNPLLAQAYFNCLMHDSNRDYVKLEGEQILQALNSMGGSRAIEIFDNLKAKFEFEFGDKEDAFVQIDIAIGKYKEIIYPLLTKLEMSISNEDISLIQSSIEDIKRRNPSPGHKIAIYKGEAVIAALSGDYDRALRMLSRELSELSEGAKEKLERKFRRISCNL